jgi:hypothetical protein
MVGGEVSRVRILSAAGAQAYSVYLLTGSPVQFWIPTSSGMTAMICIIDGGIIQVGTFLPACHLSADFVDLSLTGERDRGKMPLILMDD